MTDEQNPHPGFVSITTPTPYPEVYVRSTDVSMVRVLTDNSCSIWLGNSDIGWTVKASASEVLRRIAAAESVQTRKVTMAQVRMAAQAAQERKDQKNTFRRDWDDVSQQFRDERVADQIAAFRAAGFEVEV